MVLELWNGGPMVDPYENGDGPKDSINVEECSYHFSKRCLLRGYGYYSWS
jgi:hypothetical protein